VEYLTAREAVDVSRIEHVVREKSQGTFVIDDFHRLDQHLQIALADLAKTSAEQANTTERFFKLVLIGINQVGSELVQLVPDIAKRTGIHRIQPGTATEINKLIASGCEALNIEIAKSDQIFVESGGDYWLTQLLCQTVCTMHGILQTSEARAQVAFDFSSLRRTVVEKLRAAYYPAVKEFCRGRRFRPSNDPYFKLLRAVGQQNSSIVDLNELANANSDVRGSINNIKEHRLIVLLQSKPACAKHFYYSQETKNFAIEDPIGCRGNQVLS
jgi:hypothetical protein